MKINNYKKGTFKKNNPKKPTGAGACATSDLMHVTWHFTFWTTVWAEAGSQSSKRAVLWFYL